MRPRFIIRGSKLTNARVSQLFQYLTAAKRPGYFVDTRFSPGLEAALILLPFRSTDPKQRVNPQSRLPKITNGPSICQKSPQDSIGSTNPGWLETTSGSPVLAAFALELIRALSLLERGAIANDPHNSSFNYSVVRELRCSLKHARSLG